MASDLRGGAAHRTGKPRSCHLEARSVDDADAEKAGAALAALVGALLVFLSWQPLSRLFAADRDNVFVIYLAFGLPLLLPGLWLLAHAARTWRNAVDDAQERTHRPVANSRHLLGWAALVIAVGLGAYAVVSAMAGHSDRALAVAAVAALHGFVAGTVRFA